MIPDGPADGVDFFVPRQSGPGCRGRFGVGGSLGHRPLALDAEPVGAFDTVEREGEAGEVLGRHRRRARAEIGHRDQRQRSQGLDRDERGTSLGTGLARALPFLGAAIGLALHANQAAHLLGEAALGGRRRAISVARAGAWSLHGAIMAPAARAVHRTMVQGRARPKGRARGKKSREVGRSQATSPPGVPPSAARLGRHRVAHARRAVRGGQSPVRRRSTSWRTLGMKRFE